MSLRALLLAAAGLLVVSGCGADPATLVRGMAASLAATTAPSPAPSPAASTATAADETATGIITSIDSPVLGRVDSFELLADDGRSLTFDTTELESRPEFPTAHLGEHQVLAHPIVVTYREDGDRLVVIRVDDAE